MSKFSDFFKFSVKPIQDIESGFYTSHNLMHGETPYRLHLRIEPNQNGVLTLNASTIIHLNKTAMEMAYFLIQGQKPSEITQTISNRYKAPKSEIKEDVDAFYETLMGFIHDEDLAPTSILGFIDDSDETKILAPYRLDCHFSDPHQNNGMTNAEWKVVFEKAFNAGIPHVMLLDVPEEQKESFLELLTHLEDLGLVSGLVTTSDFLKDSEFLNQLLLRGLDHLVLDADPCITEHRTLITKILDLDLFTCLRMPYKANVDYADILEDLFEHGINAFAFSHVEDEMDEGFTTLQKAISEKQIPILDDMPWSRKLDIQKHTPHHEHDIKHNFLTLLPNGDLIIPFIEPIMVGNLLQEDWDSLWAKCRKYSDG